MRADETGILGTRGMTLRWPRRRRSLGGVLHGRRVTGQPAQAVPIGKSVLRARRMTAAKTGLGMRFLLGTLGVAVTAQPGAAQWQNRYPRVQGYGHHVYLEGYELPILTTGPTDPAPAPDGRRIAFSARGWIWVMDLASRTARRLTSGGGLDFRPAWAPSGDRLAFVRDDGSDTWIVVVDSESGRELAVVDTPTLDLDPAWSADGSTLYYTSGRAGTLDVWAVSMAEGDAVPTTSGVPGGPGRLGQRAVSNVAASAVQLTADLGIEMRSQPFPDGDRFLVLAKRGGDRVEVRSRSRAETRALVVGDIASMARPALDPAGKLLAVSWPTIRGDGWELRLHSVEQPGSPVTLVKTGGRNGAEPTGGGAVSGGVPLAPAWSPDGAWVYYAQADETETMGLKRVRAAGGAVEDVTVGEWEWGTGVARLRIRTRIAGAPEREGATSGSARDGDESVAPAHGASAGMTPARLSVVDASGHSFAPEEGTAHFDGAGGRVFFYSSGLAEVVVPTDDGGVAQVEVSAVQGLATPEVRKTVAAPAGEATEVVLELAPVWDARKAGWMSGDHHFHLNYGGPYDLAPSDIAPKMRGEALDVATPLLANLHNRYEDQDLWGWQKSDAPPLIRFGQEIRSHFLGHVGLIEAPELYWPWVWGPGYEVYGSDDRTNAEVLAFGRRHGGIGYYVHPVGVADPFAESNRERVPVELVADAVLGDVDALEVMCLWSSFEGTAALWHSFLNLGVAVAPSAGTDVMLNFYRTMALGVTRVYVDTGGALDWPTYLAGLRQGRSFVTNGPFLHFRVGGEGEGVAGSSDAGSPGDPLGVGPGGVVASGPASWSLDVATATEVDTVEVLVNGQVVFAEEGIAQPGRRSYAGTVDLPAGGWIAARARGGATRWPSMDTAPFAHTAPIWIGERGSADPDARRQAATELLTILHTSRARLVAAYADTPIPRLAARFDEAEAHLRTLASGSDK